MIYLRSYHLIITLIGYGIKKISRFHLICALLKNEEECNNNSRVIVSRIELAKIILLYVQKLDGLE